MESLGTEGLCARHIAAASIAFQIVENLWTVWKVTIRAIAGAPPHPASPPQWGREEKKPELDCFVTSFLAVTTVWKARSQN
jgi:hypothetical protein